MNPYDYAPVPINRHWPEILHGIRSLSAFVFVAAFASFANQAHASERILQSCKVNDARLVLNDGSISDLCGCETVTSGMIKYIQNRRDFAAVLRQTSASCSALAKLLSDVPSATLRDWGHDPDNDYTSGNRPSGSSEGTEPVSLGGGRNAGGGGYTGGGGDTGPQHSHQSPSPGLLV